MGYESHHDENSSQSVLNLQIPLYGQKKKKKGLHTGKPKVAKNIPKTQKNELRQAPTIRSLSPFFFPKVLRRANQCASLRCFRKTTEDKSKIPI
jgi:hypothetical protein